MNQPATNPPAAIYRAPRPNVDALTAPASLLRVETVQMLVGLSKTQVYRLMGRNAFPQPIRLGTRCSRWRSSDITRWLEAQT